MVCGRLNIDVWEAVELANHHPRVGILSPGPGVGGHCIAVDPWFIADSAPAETTLIQAARQVNDAKSDHIVEAIKKAAEAVSISRIACLGLSYKADTDDLRESPAVKIVKSLALGKVGEVVVVEPHIRVLPEELQDLSSLKLVEIDAALDQSDIVVLLVDHQLFKAVDRARLQGKVVIDTRGIWR
jgi:UDP-N-acetyl-D-mannosaminuronic acid dehydrogenase